MLKEIIEKVNKNTRLNDFEKKYIEQGIEEEFPSIQSIQRVKKIDHPIGIKINGAPACTWLKTWIILAGRKLYGKNRNFTNPYFQMIEEHIVARIMRANFVHNKPKGYYCCPTCAIAVLQLYYNNALYLLNCKELIKNVEDMVLKNKKNSKINRLIEWVGNYKK